MLLTACIEYKLKSAFGFKMFSPKACNFLIITCILFRKIHLLKYNQTFDCLYRQTYAWKISDQLHMSRYSDNVCFWLHLRYSICWCCTFKCFFFYIPSSCFWVLENHEKKPPKNFLTVLENFNFPPVLLLNQIIL